ncbi:AsmA family protein [Photobacterium lucens]|uniref:AsmA family protein n=1 Tax=Photobacterium lucens TaxID=2562949 RepID=UPI00136E58CF|nr:AsmA family protein [Photobacterium lucens]MZG56016.1 AsmA family protein [Photobacterium lucens]MZG79598.1 AsmA family protein [Photobacterium lucens]
MRWIAKVIVTVLLLSGLSLAALITLLQTRHATPIINHALALFSDYQLTDTDIQYDIQRPLEVILHNPTLTENQTQLLSAKRITLSLSSRSFALKQTIFANVVINGIEMDTQQLSAFKHLSDISIDRLAINDLNLNTANMTIKHAQLQLDNWQYRSTNLPWWKQFDGVFQLSAPEMTWHHLSLNNVLLNGKKDQQLWHLSGYSGQWQRAKFNGQAQYDERSQQLTLDQITITQLHLQQSQPLPAWEQWIIDATPIEHIVIKRADMLDTSIEQRTWAADNINLSLENWSWPQSYWEQDDAHLSVSATNAKWQDIVLEQPIIDLHFTPELMTSQGISAQLLGGYMRVDGALSPDAIKLKALTLSGLKGLLPPHWQEKALALVSTLSTFTIDNVDINNLQLTSTDATLPFQLAGINIEGKNTVVKHNQKWGLWQGDIQASLGFASINQIIFTDPIAEMSSHNGDWKVSKLVLPFNHGMLTADGEIQLAEKGKPWQLSVTNDSVPANVIYRWLRLPLPLNGAIDGTMKAHGLADNQRSFNYSLSGQADLTFRDIQLDNIAPTQLFSEWSKKSDLLDLVLPKYSSDLANNHQTLTLLPLHITADRGKITVPTWLASNEHFSLSLSSQWDLATPKQQQMEWVLKEDCQQLERRWQAGQREVNSFSTCNGNIR